MPRKTDHYASHLLQQRTDAMICSLPRNILIMGQHRRFLSMTFLSVSDPAIVIVREKMALPTYVVPREKFPVGEMPLNTNGKVDRRAVKQDLIVRSGKREPHG
jgi:acyl-CoA synthetase (AMP-forming)/AMP-acid ligase II